MRVIRSDLQGKDKGKGVPFGKRRELYALAGGTASVGARQLKIHRKESPWTLPLQRGRVKVFFQKRSLSVHAKKSQLDLKRGERGAVNAFSI